MGVRGLQSFMERNCSDVAYEVSIKDLVERYRRETGRDVVIVVDGSSCLRPLYGHLDWICGGQIREYVEIFKNFIQSFQDLGVKLVFFFDGPTQPRKRKVWVERRLKSLDDAYRVFDHIGQGRHPSQYSGDVMLPPATSYLAGHAIKSIEGCELHRTVKECDEEIAEYAIQHNCFAILAQDSDYVIYDGPQYYLSAVHLNVEKMTTINYNRWALARRLNLSPGLLPLFASLIGNDIIRSDDLQNFHRRICQSQTRGRYNASQRPNPRDVMYSVASFIRNSTDENHLYDALPLISRTVFGNEQRSSHLHLSVRSYSVSAHAVSHLEKIDIVEQSPDKEKHWKHIQKYSEMRFRDGDLDSMVYAIMHGLPYESSTGLEDFRKRDLPPSAAVYLPLRQRIYGILLHEMPGDPESHIVEEWCMQGVGSLKEAANVPITSPEPDTHPGLMTLWNTENSSADLLTKKWVLLTNAISTRLDPDKLRSIPSTLVAPTLLLFFLNNVSSPFMETWEIKAFIATAVVLPTITNSGLAAIQIARVIPRAVQLACILGRGASVIKMLMDVCGRPVPQIEVSAWHYFDGKLFQTMYQKAQSGCKPIELCNHQMSALEQFNLVQSIVLPSRE